MSAVVVCGGGVVGLAAGMMLARDGQDVTVLEADPEPPPADPRHAWDSWIRRGVAQFHQPHALFARFRHVCDAELPGLTAALEAAGGYWWDLLAALPPSLTDRTERPDDSRLRSLTARRPLVEAVFAAAAEATPRVNVRRGVRVAGLLPGAAAAAGVPHVGGVVTEAGEQLAADLVVDATGRRTASTVWLAGIGARKPRLEAEEYGFAYYSRYFTSPVRPVARGPAMVPLGTISVLTLPADNDTWAVVVCGRSGDTPLKALRDPDVHRRVVAACPVQAPWLEGAPTTDVLVMAGPLDACRRFVVDGTAVATGFAAVGDAWACTNPSAGRGLTVGLLHAQLLRRTFAAHGDSPPGFAAAWHAGTEEEVAPFYRSQVLADRDRFAEMAALGHGEVPPRPRSDLTRLIVAARTDADALRALLEVVTCMALPAEVYARPQVRAALDAAGDAVPGQFPGPDRQQLLRLLDA